MTPWRKFAHLPAAERRLILAAAALTVGVTLALRVAPFRLVRAALTRVARPMRGGPLPVPRIVWAVTAATRRVPGANRCLVRALVARALLARHRHPAELRLGVARWPAGALAAHAWVESEGRIVIGGAERPGFSPLPPLQEAGS